MTDNSRPGRSGDDYFAPLRLIFNNARSRAVD